MAFSSFSRQGGHPPPLAEINTTPLVDVMLVLLVIFLITAPVLQQAVVLDLPQASAAPLPAPPRVVRVALNAGGVGVLGRCAAAARAAGRQAGRRGGRSTRAAFARRPPYPL